MNENVHECTPEALADLSSVVEHVESLVPVSITVEHVKDAALVSVQQLQDLTGIASYVSVTAIRDGIQLSRELQLIESLIKAENKQDFLSQIQRHVSFGLANTSASSLVLDYWKRLAWLLETETVCQSYLMDGILYNYQQFLWANMAGLTMGLKGEDEELILNGNILAFASDLVSLFHCLLYYKRICYTYQAD